MRGAVFHEHGGTDRIRVETVPDPECGVDDVVVRVGACSLNGFDPQILAGTTGLRTPLPMVPCGDFAGEIVEIGSGVSGSEWKVGDRVCPHPFVLGEGMTGETRVGAASELVRIPARNLIRIPEGVSDEDAASLPIAYGTAYRMIVTRGAVRAGETVLVLGATGGVGTGALQLAKAAGAAVVATGSADWKLDRLRELGADQVIDTSKEDFVEAIHRLYGKPRLMAGGGVDVIVNYIGGDTWARSLRCLAPGGRMLTCGATAGYAPPTDLRYIWSFEHTILGTNGWTPPEQVEVLRWVAEGRLRPAIHAIRGLDATAASIQELIDRKVFGKTVIRPNE